MPQLIHISFIEVFHEIISLAMLFQLLIQVAQLSVTSESVSWLTDCAST